MPIPLQKLPYLALKEVLSTMKLKEIFKIASLSKENARRVKPCISSQRFLLTIFSSDGWKIESECSRNFEYWSEDCSKNGIFLDKTGHEVLEFIVEVFNKPNICLLIKNDMEKFHNYSRFFGTLGLKIGQVTFYRCKQGELQNMLEAFKGVPEIHIYSCILEKKIQFDNNINYYFESIEIRISVNSDLKWRKDLLFSLIDCKKVNINGITHRSGGKLLPTKDLKAFLERWIEGSKMEQFSTTAFDLSKFSTVFKPLGQVIPVRAVNILIGSHKRY
uniref:F-box domain-containing protein n=1 Tax=Caenorhabditis tropicalis TaxID=1561998 RepID=A0A1I7TBH9_9PELO